MKAWQRPHVKMETYEGNEYLHWCHYCLRVLRDYSTPCSARTVRLSDNPAAVRMIKAMGKEMKFCAMSIKSDTVMPNIKMLCYDVRQGIGHSIRAAVRAYWEEEK